MVVRRRGLEVVVVAHRRGLEVVVVAHRRGLEVAEQFLNPEAAEQFLSLGVVVR